MDEKKEELRISPSSMNTWFECNRKWYYKYQLKLPEKITIDLARGSVVHKVLEELFDIKLGKNYKKQLKNKVKTLLEKYWKEYKVEGVSTENGMMYYKESELMVLMFIDRLLYQIEILLLNGKASSPFHAFMLLKPKLREHHYVDKELNFGGYVDCVQTDFDGNTILVDYKTSSKWKNVLPENYRRQLGSYAYLYKVNEGTLPDLACVNYLRYGESYYIEITPSVIQSVINDIKLCRERTQSKEIKDYPKREQNLCKYCSYFDKCKGDNNE